MIMLQIIFVITVLTFINCFQFAAAILAKQLGKSFWRWFGISFFLPIISLIILIFLWDTDQPASSTNH
jgi:hypothetical protein